MEKALIIGVGNAGACIGDFLLGNLHHNPELLLIDSDQESLNQNTTTNKIRLELTLSVKTIIYRKLIRAINNAKDETPWPRAIIEEARS